MRESCGANPPQIARGRWIHGRIDDLLTTPDLSTDWFAQFRAKVEQVLPISWQVWALFEHIAGRVDRSWLIHLHAPRDEYSTQIRIAQEVDKQMPHVVARPDVRASPRVLGIRFRPLRE